MRRVFAEMANDHREEEKEQHQPMTCDNEGNGNGKIAMKRQLGLVNGIAMIVGNFLIIHRPLLLFILYQFILNMNRFHCRIRYLENSSV